MKICVIALGGNALLKKGEKASISRQFQNVLKITKQIAKLAKKYNLVITHGNGPQIGSALIRVEQTLGKTYSLPLEVLVAETEAEIGYILQQNLFNELSEKKIKKPVVSVLTQVIVDRRDPAFRNPAKFIGPYYTKPQAEKLKKKGMQIKADPRGGFRRVVASPLPKQIVEANIIKKFIRQAIVIAAGGGGIPVHKTKSGLKGIEAVIDKDLASAVLANNVKAKLLLILTDMPYIYTNFRKKNQKPIRKLTAKQAKQLASEGHFPPGSMGPKVQAAINFLKTGKKRKVIITSPNLVEKALKGQAGTLIE